MNGHSVRAGAIDDGAAILGWITRVIPRTDSGSSTILTGAVAANGLELKVPHVALVPLTAVDRFQIQPEERALDELFDYK